ncbi:MAG: DUF4296 domain-containing protein [Ginsengibacter sp.]
MKRPFIYILILIMVSCKDKYEVPGKIIPPEKMTGIMWDVIRAQELAKDIKRKDSLINLPERTHLLTAQVFKIYNINSTTFKESYDWYLDHPNIMQNVIDSLYTQKQREINEKRESKYINLNKDSLRKKFPER